MKKYIILLLLLFLFQTVSYSAIKYLYNSSTVLYNVSFPLFDANGVYYADTAFAQIDSGVNAVGSGACTQPYATWEYAKTQLTSGDELQVIKSDTDYINTTDFSVANIKVNSNGAILIGEMSITENIINFSGFIRDGQFANIHLLNVLNGYFTYNIIRNLKGTSVLKIPLVVNGNYTAIFKNNYIYNIFLNIAWANQGLMYSNSDLDMFENNVCDSNYITGSYQLFGGEKIANTQIKNNYITRAISDKFVQTHSAVNHSGNYLSPANTITTKTGAIQLATEDLLVINGDTYFFNRSDTAGFDITGMEFFLKYGDFSPEVIANVLGLYKFDYTNDSIAEVVSFNGYNIDTQVAICSAFMSVSGWVYDSTVEVLNSSNYPTDTANLIAYDTNLPDSVQYYYRLIILDTASITHINGQTATAGDTIFITDTTVMTVTVENLKGASQYYVWIYDAADDSLVDTITITGINAVTGLKTGLTVGKTYKMTAQAVVAAAYKLP